jgi:hypothetical protein
MISLKDRSIMEEIYKDVYATLAAKMTAAGPYQVPAIEQLSASPAFQEFRKKADAAWETFEVSGAKVGIASYPDMPRVDWDMLDPANAYGLRIQKGKEAYTTAIKSAVAELCAAEKLDAVMNAQVVFGHGKQKSFAGFGTAAPGIMILTWAVTCKGELVIKAVAPQGFYSTAKRLPLVIKDVMPTAEYWDLVRGFAKSAAEDYVLQMKLNL